MAAKQVAEKKKQEKDKLKARLEKLADDRSRVEESITQASGLANELSAGLDSEAQELDAEFTQNSKAVGDFITESTTKIASRLLTTRDEITGTLASASDSLRFYMGFQLFLLAIGGILGGYFTFAYVGLAVFGLFVSTWFVAGSVVVLRARNQLNRIKEHSSMIGVQVDNLNVEMASDMSSIPRPTADTSGLRKTAGLVKGATTQVVSTVARHTPIIKDILEGRDELVQRDQFIAKVNHALTRYGFVVQTEGVQLAFVNEFDWSANDQTNLEALAKIASGQFGGVPSQLFELMYYETWDRDNMSEIWEEVKKSDALRIALAQLLIAHGLVTTKGAENDRVLALGNLLKTDTFDLPTIRARGETFFDELATLKKTCLGVLDTYGLSLVIGNGEFLAMTPIGPIEKWHAEVVSFLASKISPDPEDKGGAAPSRDETGGVEVPRGPAVEMLLIVEGVGDPMRLALWKQIVQSQECDENVRKLALYLSHKKLPRAYDEFSEDVYLRHLMLVLKTATPDFVTEYVGKRVRQMEQEILQTKLAMAKTSSKFLMGVDDFEFANSYVPNDVSRVEEELVVELSSRAGTDIRLTKLLYYTAVASDKADQSFREMTMKKEKTGIQEPIGILAQYLIDKKFVPAHKFNENLTTLLTSQSSFNLSEFQSLYTRYDLLVSKLSAFHEFVRIRKVSAGHGIPSFEEVLRICPPRERISFAEMFMRTARTMVSNDLGAIKLDDDRHAQLSLAACGLSLQLEYDPAAEELARQLRWKPYGARVLYRYSKLVAESVSKTAEASLLEAAKEAVPEIADDPNYEYYLEKLQDGVIVQGANQLMAMRVSDLDAIKKRADELGLENEVLHNYVDSTKELLSSVDVNVAKDFLNQEVVSAYLLTVPSTSKLFGFLQENEQALKDAARMLRDEKKDDRFLNLMQWEQMGQATRIGLVPYGMKFEEFTSDLDTLFTKVEGLAVGPRKPSFVILRIYPSQDSMKVIHQSGFRGEQPAEIVSRLIHDYVEGESGIILAALLEKRAMSKSAFNNVISKLIDAKENNLLTLTKDLISTILGANVELKSKFEDGTVDTELKARYDAKTLTGVCKNIHSRTKVNPSLTKEEFEKMLGQILPELASIPSRDGDILRQSIFNRMRVVGTVLNE